MYQRGGDTLDINTRIFGNTDRIVSIKTNNTNTKIPFYIPTRFQIHIRLVCDIRVNFLEEGDCHKKVDTIICP